MKRVAIVLACILIIVGGLLYFALPLLTTAPVTHEEQIGETTIAIELDRDAVLFPGDCFGVAWELDAIQAVFVNRLGSVGVDARTLCAQRAHFRMILPDGAEHVVSLQPRALMREPAAMPIIALAAVASLVMLAGLGGFFAPQRWVTDSKQFVADVKAFWQEVRQSPQAHLLCLLIIIGIGIAFRVILMPREFTIDEVESYNSYTFNFWQALASYDDPNNHLLNSFFLFVNSRLFGASEVALRLHVFIFGLAAMPLAYVVGRLYYSPMVGLGAAALMAGANIMVEYSVMARGYILQTTFFLLMLILALHIIRKNNALSWLLFALITPLAFFALPTAVYMYLGLGTWMLLTLFFGKERWPRIGHWFAYTTLAGWLTISLYLPTLSTDGLQLIIANGYVQRRTGAELFAQEAPFMIQNLLLSWNMSAVAAVVLGFGMVLGLVWHRKIAQHRIPLIPIFFVVIAPVIILQQTVAYPRVWTFIFPVFAMTSIAGWVVLANELGLTKWARLGYVLAISVTIGLGAYGLGSKWQRYSSDEYHNAIAFFEENLRSPDEDVILSYNPATETLLYYFERYDIPTTYVSTGHQDPNDHFFMISRIDHDPTFVLSYYEDLDVDPNKFEVVWQQDRLWIHEYRPDSE